MLLWKSRQERSLDFLEPNVAGKSTIIKILTTMLRSSDGTASIFGHDIVLDKGAVSFSIDVVFQDATFDGKLTGGAGPGIFTRNCTTWIATCVAQNRKSWIWSACATRWMR